MKSDFTALVCGSMFLERCELSWTHLYFLFWSGLKAAEQKQSWVLAENLFLISVKIWTRLKQWVCHGVKVMFPTSFSVTGQLSVPSWNQDQVTHKVSVPFGHKGHLCQRTRRSVSKAPITGHMPLALCQRQTIDVSASVPEACVCTHWVLRMSRCPL